MSQFRFGLMASICCTLLAACGSNSTTSPGSDGGSDAGPGNDAGPAGDGGSAPGAPILSFTTSTAGVALTWTLPGAYGDERFTVLRSDESAPFAQVTGATSLHADAYNDLINSALPGSIHAYEVTATNGNGTGRASNIVTVQQAPGDVFAGGSDTRVLLAWGALATAASYDVYRVPAAGSSGTPTKVGNTQEAEYIDDGSTAALTKGTTYHYQVVALAPDGGQPSTGSNIATTVALGLDVSAIATHVNDTNTAQTAPFNANLMLAALAIDGGTVEHYQSFSTSTATVVTGVPTGTYYFTTQPVGPYFLTNIFTDNAGSVYYFANSYFEVATSRSLDLSNATAGRADAVTATNLQSQAAMGFALTGLDAWSNSDGGAAAAPNDTFISLSQGAGNYLAGLEFDLDGYQGDAGVDTGGTAFNGVESIAGLFGDNKLIDSSKGDLYYLYQLHAEKSDAGAGVGVEYQTATKAISRSTIDMIDGGSPSAISGSMSATTSTKITGMVVKNSAFAAQHAAINPAATLADVSIEIAAAKDFTTYGYYGTPAPLFNAKIDASSGTDLNFGSFSFGNPFPASWEPLVYVTYGFNVDITMATDAGPAVPLTFSAVSGFFAPVDGFNWASGIAPALSPMTAVKINGADAFTDQLNVTTSPTISWTAAASGPTVTNYFVNLWELSVDSGGATAVGNFFFGAAPLAQFTTNATSLKIPAGLLQAETSAESHWYFATIDAEVMKDGSGAVVDQTLTPYKQGVNYGDIEVVTNKFCTGPGVSIPTSFGNDLVTHHPRPRTASVAHKASLSPRIP